MNNNLSGTTSKNSHHLILLAFTLTFISVPVLSQQPSRQTSSSTNRIDGRIDGFTANHSTEQKKWEEKFSAIPTASSAREHLRYITSKPHIAGSPQDYQVAVYIRDQLRKYGWNAELKEYQVLLAYPKSETVIEILTPRRTRLKIREEALSEDKTSSDPNVVPLFNAYSATGDVTAPIVYVNFGLPEDYEALRKLGVDVKGKIVIARYGNSFRGVKAQVAEENGAAGLIIYSDPAQTGYMQGDGYPKGAWGSPSTAQRGSLLYIFKYSGDPLTPGAPSINGTPRIKIEEATTMPRIPVQPISYGDAEQILKELRGPLRPKGFQGGLPFAYHVGGDNAVKIRLKTEMDFQARKIWNVIARIDGTSDKDRWVIIGGHHDAWVFGAVDPNSGTSSILEMARGIGETYK
ncbi:MAG: PA domain-containing protein, partial [Pyrinomonadaceae bacterium]